MSHFTKVQTQITDESYLLKALKDLGYQPEIGRVQVRGYYGATTLADLKVAANPSYDIGFTKTEAGTYQIEADWWGCNMSESVFAQKLTQRYSYHAAVDSLAEQGFELTDTITEQDGTIRLILNNYSLG
jgi:hypothetical protein